MCPDIILLYYDTVHELGHEDMEKAFCLRGDRALEGGQLAAQLQLGSAARLRPGPRPGTAPAAAQVGPPPLPGRPPPPPPPSVSPTAGASRGFGARVQAVADTAVLEGA